MVRSKAWQSGFRKAKSFYWSKREMYLLRKLYPSRTAQQIADQIGRTVLATKLRIVKLGRKKRKRKGRRKSPAGLFGCLELVVKHRPRDRNEAMW
ncbi:MAG: hypothetical protein ACFFDT_21975 [Candidatus Hodarchaeota archaeon]